MTSARNLLLTETSGLVFGGESFIDSLPSLPGVIERPGTPNRQTGFLASLPPVPIEKTAFAGRPEDFERFQFLEIIAKRE
jgi:hypothetical protein